MDVKPEIRVKPNSYQPRKTEIEDVVSMEGTPEDLRSAVMKPVHIIEDEKA